MDDRFETDDTDSEITDQNDMDDRFETDNTDSEIADQNEMDDRFENDNTDSEVADQKDMDDRLETGDTDSEITDQKDMNDMNESNERDVSDRKSSQNDKAEPAAVDLTGSEDSDVETDTDGRNGSGSFNVPDNPGRPAGPHATTGDRRFWHGFWAGIGTAVFLVVCAIIGFTLGLRLNYSRNSSQTVSVSEDGTDGDLAEEELLSSDFMTELWTIGEYISDYFLYDYDVKTLQDSMLTALLDALDDPYSVYYNEASLESFNAQTTGEYSGIGCSVSQDLTTGEIVIVTPYEGSSAAEAGLLAGDILYAADGVELNGIDLDLAVSMIKGEEGTSVTLTILRDGDLFDVEVERRQVTVQTVAWEMLPSDIGYIMVSSFEAVTAEQFISAYEELESAGMRGLIIDMRDNGGGLLTTVEDMLDYLLPEGLIFYAKDKTGTKYLEYISDADAALDVPLAVLVNGNTASAAEVFSGNIQEFGLGTLVGTTTFGKGIMQNTYYTNMLRTRAVKLTVADYYIHSDRNIDGIGITPDVTVELSDDAEDYQLEEAYRIVSEQLQ